MTTYRCQRFGGSITCDPLFEQVIDLNGRRVILYYPVDIEGAILRLKGESVVKQNGQIQGPIGVTG